MGHVGVVSYVLATRCACVEMGRGRDSALEKAAELSAVIAAILISSPLLLAAASQTSRTPLACLGRPGVEN